MNLVKNLFCLFLFSNCSLDQTNHEPSGSTNTKPTIDLSNYSFANERSGFSDEESAQESDPESVIKPVDHGIKKYTHFSIAEQQMDNYWLKKKRVFSQTLVSTRRQELANNYAREMNSLSRNDFIFLTTQTYFWSDLISVEPRIFAAELQPEKLRIMADTVANKSLIKLVSDIPFQIAKLFASLDLEHPDFIAKLNAGLPAVTLSSLVDDELYKKIRAYRQKMQFAHRMSEFNQANHFLKKLILARKLRQP